MNVPVARDIAVVPSCRPVGPEEARHKRADPAYLPHVDGLRALAVTSVLIYHLHPSWLPGGFAGVDIFFVISGFIVSASVAHLDRRSLVRFAVHFYARRFRRIVPALMACLLTTVLATTLIVPESWLSNGVYQTGLRAFYGVSNLYLAKTQNDYFAPSAEYNAFTHTWSLGVEEQFYLVFPLVFFAWTRGDRRRRGLLLALIVAACLACLGYSALLGQSSPARAFYLTTSRGWQLAAGVILFAAMSLAGRRFDGRDPAPPRWFTAGALFCVLPIAATFWTGQPGQFPVPGAIPVVAGTLGLLFFLHGQQSRLTLVLFHPAVLFVGRTSYSLYLWHWPVLVLFRWTVGLDGAGEQAAAMALAILLALASYFAIERPARRSTRMAAWPRATVVAGGLLGVALSALAAAAIHRGRGSISASTVVRHAGDWYPTAPDREPDFPGCAVRTQRLPDGPRLTMIFTRQNCGSGHTAPRVLAFGDSHALAYQPLFKRYVLATGATVILDDNGGCPVLSLLPGVEQSSRCRANTRATADRFAATIAPGDVVFLPSLRMPRFVDQYKIFPDEPARSSVLGAGMAVRRGQWAKDGEPMLRRFIQAGARVVLEGPKPIFRSPAYRCAEPYNRSIRICRAGSTMARQELEQLSTPILESLRTLAAQVPGTSVWDPFPILCPGAVCSEYRDGRPLYFDSDHLSGFANRLLTPAFIAHMGSIATR